MAESTPIQRVQYEEGIHPVKSKNESAHYSKALEEHALSEKNSSADLEERAVRLANADLNRKNKQVCFSTVPFYCGF